MSVSRRNAIVWNINNSTILSLFAIHLNWNNLYIYKDIFVFILHLNFIRQISLKFHCCIAITIRQHFVECHSAWGQGSTGTRNHINLAWASFHFRTRTIHKPVIYLHLYVCMLMYTLIIYVRESIHYPRNRLNTGESRKCG